MTLGTGDYVPVGAWPQVAAMVAAYSGLFLVTLSITYLLNVVTAVVDQPSSTWPTRSCTASPAPRLSPAGQEVTSTLASRAQARAEKTAT